MSLLTCASGASVWRGYDYYKENRVQAFEKIADDQFMGFVSGSGDAQYTTIIDLAHPRKSKCNCPHADGKRIVCKHMIALFFTVFPEEAKKFYDEAMRYQEEEEQREEEQQEQIIKYIYSLKKDELRQTLLDVLFSGPEWQYDRFIQENIIEI